jgi:hypothetical protein
MRSFFRNLLRPSPTLPFNPYGRRSDNRTSKQQAISGLRIAGGLVAGFLVLTLAFGGISTLTATDPPDGRHVRLMAWAAVSLAGLILFLTADRWAAFGITFLFGPALLKSIAAFIFAMASGGSVSEHSLTSSQASELALLCVTTIALNWRFLRRHPAPTTFLDRIALTYFVLASMVQITVSYHWPPWPLVSGLVAMLAAFLYSWLRVGKASRLVTNPSGASAPE